MMHTPYEYFREEGKKEIVMGRLKKRMDVMQGITQTPVLLSLFCTTVDESVEGLRPKLPETRHNLYRSALSKRLQGRNELRQLLQSVAYQSFIDGNKREFTIDDVVKIVGRQDLGYHDVGNPFPNFRDGEIVPLVKVIDTSIGLFQFAHLSFQEALAANEALSLHPLSDLTKPGIFAPEHLPQPKATNFLRLCDSNDPTHMIWSTVSLEMGSLSLPVTVGFSYFFVFAKS
jgi:hypothetical protein